MINKNVFTKLVLDFKESVLPHSSWREMDVPLNMPLKRAITIIGPRRSGKTYFLYSLINKILAEGIDKSRIFYVNFETAEFVGAGLKDLSKLLDVYYEIYPENKNKKVWLFFDELQNIKSWEIFARAAIDSGNIQLIISGSSSKLLSREIATSLRGRTLTYTMLPFSFLEFLKLNSLEIKKFFSSNEERRIINLYNKYFFGGGYPETLIFPEARKKIINEIIDVTILMDLAERHKIRNTKIIKMMFNYLARGKEFSVNKFFSFLKSLNYKISKNTLYNYLDYFNDAFIFFPLRRFSFSLKKIEQSLAKIYTVDNGFIEEIVGDDKGKKHENMVFLSLLRRGYVLNNNLFYYNEGAEVDFIIVKKEKVEILIQACYDLSDFRTREREVKSILSASSALKCNRLLIITHDYEAEEKINGKKIIFIPLWKWLLEN